MAFNALRLLALTLDLVGPFHPLEWFSFGYETRLWQDLLEAPSTPCLQAHVIHPVENEKLWSEISSIIGTDDYKTRAIDWLAGAVRIPSVNYT